MGVTDLDAAMARLDDDGYRALLREADGATIDDLLDGGASTGVRSSGTSGSARARAARRSSRSTDGSAK
jgi:hypothetical protein